MKHWFCGFSATNNSSVAELSEPLIKPLDSEMLWSGSNPFWICGNWEKQQVITLFGDSVHLAIVGTCLAPYRTLVELFQNAVKTKDYSQLIRLPGNYNLIVQDETDTYIFTDVAGLKSVFYAEYESNIVYSSLAIPLRQLIKAEVDKTWLATFLMGMTTPSLLQNRSPFCNIQSVPPGHYLHISSGKVICKRYWKAPEQYISFSEGAKQLREQLLTAVEGRAKLYGNISSDLSGGFDSTSLALIAAKSLAEQGQKLHTITHKSISAIETEDVKWAEHAASLYPNIEAIMLEASEVPQEYSYLENIPLTDAPDSTIANIGQLSYLMQIIKSKDSRLHMSGDGGDAALVVSWSYLADLLKRREIRKFINHTYGWSRVSLRSPITLISKAVKLGLTSYRQWLLRQAKQLVAGELLSQSLVSESTDVSLGWDSSPQAANWYTKENVDLVATDLKKLATTAVPFADIPGQNEAIATIYANGMVDKVLQQIAETYGVNLEFPFLDGLVIDACLSVKPEERTTPFAFKPLLSEALQHDIPRSIFVRNTKGDYTTDEFNGRKQNFPVIDKLLQTCLLADMGLIDMKKFRPVIKQFSMGFDTVTWHFNQTLTAELWLRSLNNNNQRFWM
ncbi:MAG: albusnodin/ikarugamycin family macrolactam cyclase [Scytonematopsis contorta HA4267-MV1]|jgi:asparagine synthase (glutamine-hydrolysing)|nr:albusnodin/ikarugamycin family macrolactam cyclase [Scytonematopsis contorta HA4267-MV1]